VVVFVTPSKPHDDPFTKGKFSSCGRSSDELLGGAGTQICRQAHGMYRHKRGGDVNVFLTIVI
jgi:hypothetical protein